MKEMITLGQIVRPHGVRGEVKVLSDFDETMLNPKLKFVFVDDKKYPVKGLKFLNDSIVLKLDGIENMDQAETFRNKDVFISHDDLVELDDDEYYVEDLVGCSVCFEDGTNLGKLVDIQNYGASDILVLKNGTEETLCTLVEGLILDVMYDKMVIVVDQKKFLEVTTYAD